MSKKSRPAAALSKKISGKIIPFRCPQCKRAEYDGYVQGRQDMAREAIAVLALD